MDEEAIFAAALGKASPAERRTFLAEACAGDDALRASVEALLQAHDNPDSFLEPRDAGLALTLDEQPIREPPGTVIGPYKLLEQIGEGGFGVVFMAEQTQPVRRKVALKVLKPGMDTRQVVARFEAERQALALMDHPNIAHVFDSGETTTGRPYFAMELVRGIPITDFCDQCLLQVRERLELFLPVCQAVQHAHQKGVIHRDIKPSNVLVTLHDGTPLVKVIDFGIAKALDQQLTDKTLFTGFAQMLGTPMYMSPEQAALSNIDVDTRSDVYSLGVLIYELLTGATPFDRARLQEADYDELRQIIREEEPPRPSTRITTLGQAASTLSAQRQSDPRQLSQLLRGELDWIVMKCLEKDRNRRYESASNLAADVQHYLTDEPVLACPPSAWYRFRKFSRKNKGVLAIAVLLTTTLLLTSLVLAISNLWVTQEKNQKERALQEKEAALARATYNEALADNQRQRAEDNAKLATTVLDEIIMQEASRQFDFYQAEKAKGTARDSDRDRLEGKLFEKGLKFYEQLAQTNSTARSARREKARACQRLGWLQHELGKDPQAEESFQQAIRLRQELAAESPEDFDNRFDLAEAYHWIFPVLWKLRRFDDAEEMNRRARELFDQLVEQRPREPRCLEGQADCEFHWGYLLTNAQRLPEAREAIGRCKRLWQALATAYPGNHGYFWHVCDTYGYLIEICRREKRLPEAIDVCKEAVPLYEKLVADCKDHRYLPALTYCLAQLGDLLSEAKRPREAEDAYAKALVNWQTLVAESKVVEYRVNLARSCERNGRLFKTTGRLPQAESSYRESIRTWQKLVDDFNEEGHRNHLRDSRFALAEILVLQANHAEAAKLAEQNLQQLPANDSLRSVQIAALLARCAALAEKDPTLGEPEQRKASQGYHERVNRLMQETIKRRPDDPRLQNHAAWFLATCPDARFRDPGRAVELAQKAVETSPKSAAYWNTLGTARFRAGQYQAAIAGLKTSIELDQYESSYNGFFLAMAYSNLGDKDEARKWYDKAVAWMAQNKPADEELNRFRIEAAKLLGIKDKKD